MPKVRITMQPWRVLEVTDRQLQDLMAQKLLHSIETEEEVVPNPEPEAETADVPVSEVTPNKRPRKVANTQKEDDLL